MVTKKQTKKIVSIGLGEIGSATLGEMIRITELKKLPFEFSGVDINEDTLNNLKKKYPKVNFSKEIPIANYYIISVYTTEQVESVLNKINKENKPLVIIESTIFPKTVEYLRSLWSKNKDFNLALFPHRFNPNDPEHFVFNLHRIIGAVDDESLEKALDFYTNFIPKKLVTTVPFEIAALSKVAENAYRFIEIAISEEWRLECVRLGIDFNELRKAMNTKWNIELKEARDGIGGKCLPKDVTLLNEFFTNNKIIKSAIDINEDYKKKYGKK